MPDPPKRSTQARRRPLYLLDLMALVAAVALTLVSPTVMSAIIPAESYHTWDRRQYVSQLAALVVISWTATLVPVVLSAMHSRRRALRSYGNAAVLASAMTALFLVLRQALAVILLATGVGAAPMGIIESRLFDILENAPDASAASVVAVWTILASTRTGRRPSNWFEWLGCLVGWTWIVISILTSIVWISPIPWLIRSGIPW